MQTITKIGLLLSLIGCGACTHRVEVETKPIVVQINIDVNVKIDKELDDFFGDIDEDSSAQQ